MLRSIAPSIHAVLMSPDDAGGGGGETAKVTLPGGVVIELPKADAEKVILANQKANEERESLARKVGAAEAERKSAEEKARAEGLEKEAIKLAKDGEVAKAREILTRESNERVSRLSMKLRDQEIDSTIRRLAPGLDDAAVSDMRTLIASRAAFDAESGRTVILDEGGKPLQKDGQTVDAQAYLPGWLAARPHFQTAKTPTGNGGGGGGVTTAGTIRVADLPNLTQAQAEAMRQGKLKVVD